MTGTKVEFISGYNLFYTHFGQKKLYELLEVKTHKQFIRRLDIPEGLSNDDLEKMILAGLVWEKKGLTIEDVQGLIENEYYIKLGGNFEALNELIIDAFVDSGLMDGDKIQAIRAVKNMSSEEIKKKMFELIASKKEADMGEAPKT